MLRKYNNMLWSLERISYKWETCSTDIQHVHGTTCRNIEVASHCLCVSSNHNVYSYGYGNTAPTTNLMYFFQLILNLL
jgi:hypothetical protein